MTPVEQGRFCQSCAKQVVDFSVMTDQEILNYISNTNGSMCGRFADDQLQRPLQPAKQEKKKFWWLAAAVPLLMSFERSAAQTKTNTRPKSQNAARVPKHITLGTPGIKISTIPTNLLPLVSNRIEITGKILDAKNQPLPYATVTVINGTALAVADRAGDFVLKLHTLDDIVEINASAIGYEAASIKINTKDQKPVVLVLEPFEIIVPQHTGLIPIAYGLVGRVGGVEIVRNYPSLKTADTIFAKIDTITRKIFHTEKFKVSPNPISRGGSVNVDVKNAGTFSIQLFDNSGKLVQVKQFEAVEGTMQTVVDIPSSLAAGVYYIRLVDKKKEKEYTDKIVVE